MTAERTETLNVLLSAYSCTPGAGSEPGVGFETVRAAASSHNVWVLTRLKNVEPLEAYFREHDSVGSVRVVGLDLSPDARRLKKRLGPMGVYWYYERWQKLARRTATELAEEVRFDLAHHVTFSSEWARAGVAETDLPFIWGPLGGGAKVPAALVGSLGLRGSITELIRTLGRSAMRLRGRYRRAWQDATVVLVQNRETQALAPSGRVAKILPHGTALLTPAPPTQGNRTNEVLVVGRLIPWKGGYLALRAFAKVRHTNASLHFLGAGSDMRRLQSEAKKLGLEERVRFEGAQPREVVIGRIAMAGALLHPAVHDESPITVGEALSLGTPVVCLDHAGPPELLRRWPESPGVAVATTNVAETSGRLAEALDRFLDSGFPVQIESQRPTPSYRDSILDVYRSATADSGSSAGSTNGPSS